MRNIAQSLFLIFALNVMGCKNNKQHTIPSGWIKLKLQSGWQLYAPAGFVTESGQGVDSAPGYIYSKKDSINILYDSGISTERNENCSFQSDYKKAKDEIDTGFYKKYYNNSLQKVYIDTIDNKVAIIVKPLVSGKGTTGFEILDCESGAWLGMDKKDLSPKREKLLMKMFKTIMLTKN